MGWALRSLPAWAILGRCGKACGSALELGWPLGQEEPPLPGNVPVQFPLCACAWLPVQSTWSCSSAVPASPAWLEARGAGTGTGVPVVLHLGPAGSQSLVGTPGHSGCAATAGTGRGDSECQPSVPGARGTEAWHCQARGAQRVPEAARGAWGAVALPGDSRAQGGVPCSAQGCVHRAALTEQVLGRVLLVVCILREVVDFLAHSSEGSWEDTRQEMLRSCWPGWAAAQGPSCSTWTLRPSVGLPWSSEGWQELQHLPRRRAAPPASWL